MKSFLDILSETFSRHPDKTALVFGNESLTFAELHVRVKQVAAALQADGITTGKIVPILLPRGIDPLVALFGAWQLGAATCLLDPTYPADRIQAIRQDCGTDFLVDADCLQKVSRQNADQTDTPVVFPSPGDLAMLVFTSGSTGKPKGVMLAWHVVDSMVQNALQLFDRNDVFLYTSPISFVAVLGLAVAPLAHGLTVHIADDVTRKDVTLLADYVRKHQISACFVPPTMAPAFLQIADGQLRTLLTGSERVRNTFSTITKCVCAYGASETGSIISHFEIDQPYSNTPIGYPLPGNRIHLLDENDQPVKQGEKGEICISGQVALGYLNRPELTAERFIPNPFAEGEHDKILFRSNDIGRMLPNGAIEYVDRKDWMIKVRGNRVEPGEIEKVMLESAPLEKAVVVGFSDKSGEQKLYGCYTAKEPVDSSVLRGHLASKLPEYMIPAFLEQVESLPVNLNGKIDRTKIAPPDIAKYQADYVAPTNEQERLLCGAFAKVLGLPQIGIHDDFVRLGGDSASAVEIQLLLPQAMQISGAVLTSLRTPERIAKEGFTESIPIADDRKEWKVTYDEEWFLKKWKIDPRTGSFFVNIAFSLAGQLDVGKLQRSIRQLLSQHRVLRSVYHHGAAGNFLRTLSEVPETVLQHIRCENNEVIGEIRKRITPFDAVAGPLYRFFLFETAPEQYVLWSSLFHSIIDGPGAQILWDELADIYSDRKPAESSAPDFLDFAEWRESSSRYVSDQEFYQQMFADGLKINKMPWRTPLTTEPKPCDGVVKSHFDVTSLEKGTRHYGVSLFSSLISALGLTLGKYCRSNDIVLSLVMNTRFAFAELKKTLGMLADRFPIRLQWENEQSLGDFLRATDALLTKILHHQACSGRKWMKEAVPDMDLDLTPMMNLNYRRKVTAPSFCGVQTEPFPIPLFGEPPKVQSMLGIMDHADDSLHTSFLYPSYYFDADTAAGMNDYFAHILRKVTEGADISLADL